MTTRRSARSDARQVDFGKVRGRAAGVFFFFSNRMGCMGSLILSVVLSLILMAVLRAL